MIKEEYEKLVFWENILSHISREFTENTSLGTIIKSIKARIKHYKSVQSKEEGIS